MYKDLSATFMTYTYLQYVWKHKIYNRLDRMILIFKNMLWDTNNMQSRICAEYNTCNFPFVFFYVYTHPGLYGIIFNIKYSIAAKASQ